MKRLKYPLIPASRRPLQILRLGLLLSAIGWGISFIFTFSSWDSAADHLYLMGAGSIPYNPLLDYWLRMASAVFGLIGVASALACFRPASFTGLIGLLGPFHLLMGFVLAVAARANDLKSEHHPTFIADITFCFLAGFLILIPLVVEGWRRP